MSFSEKPLVSAVVPVYNGEKYLAETIESILGQTYSPIECVVVNDGSTDSSARICESFVGRIKYIEKTNGGVSSARNRGIAEANGELIAFLDADDLWLPEKIARQVDVLQRTDAGLVLTGVKFINGQGLVIGENIAPEHDQVVENLLLLQAETGFIATTGLVPREVLELIGGFDEDLSTSADADLVFRIALRHRIASVPEPLAMYRHHTGQMHHDLAALDRDANIAFKKLFDTPELPPRIAGLRSRAYASLESTLAIGFLRKGNYRSATGHFYNAVKQHPGTVFGKFGALVRSKVASKE